MAESHEIDAAARDAPARNWWARPCGGRDVVRLALPLVLSTASWTVMHFVDRVFLTWLSTEAIAAAMPAGMLHFTIVCFPLGVALYVNTFVAQYYGAQRTDRVGQVAWHGMYLGLVCIPALLLLIPLAPIIFPRLGHSEQLVALEIRYFQALALGGGATVLAAAQSSFFTGLGRSGIVMLVDMAASLVNIVLDYGFIFGAFGLPELGIFGAGLATALAQSFKVVVYGAVMASPHFWKAYELGATWPWNRELMSRLLRFGGPSGLQMFAEVMAFTAFTLLIGQLGERELAASTIAFSINSIAFVPMLGLGIAVATMVGQQIGAGRPDLAERATWTACGMGGAYTAVMAVLYWSLPDLFLLAHAAGSHGDFEMLRATCLVLLRFVAVYCVLDMMQIVFSSAIKGAGDMRFVLIVTLFISPIPVVFGWFGLNWWGWGLTRFWGVVTVWICMLGVIYFIRFRQGAWRKMKVIESSCPSDPSRPSEQVAVRPHTSRDLNEIPQ